MYFTMKYKYLNIKKKNRLTIQIFFLRKRKAADTFGARKKVAEAERKKKGLPVLLAHRKKI